MQNWNDEAYILSIKPFGETSLWVSVLSREHGKYAGFARGGRSGKNRSIYQVGNLINLRWQARLDEQLGTFIAEQKRAVIYPYFDDELRFAALSTIFELLDSCLNERELYPKIWQKLQEFIKCLPNDEVVESYWIFEHFLLSELGFALENILPNSSDFPRLSSKILIEQILSFKGKSLPILRNKLI